jgi:hypothetical protein
MAEAQESSSEQQHQQRAGNNGYDPHSPQRPGQPPEPEQPSSINIFDAFAAILVIVGIVQIYRLEQGIYLWLTLISFGLSLVGKARIKMLQDNPRHSWQQYRSKIALYQIATLALAFIFLALSIFIGRGFL